MKKLFKILGITVLSVVALAAVGLVWSYRLSREPTIDFELQFHSRDVGILCEWHYPSLEGEPVDVEVCYTTGLGIQCYRIEGDRVVKYHHIRECQLSETPTVLYTDLGYRLSEAIREARRSNWSSGRPPKWSWRSPFVGLHVREVPKTAYDSNDNEDTIFSCIISNMTAQIRQFETNTVGYVSMTVWEFRGSWEAVAYPLDKVPPVFKELHEVFEQCMADPSTREYHTTYIRGYPIPPPENPDRVPVLDAWKIFFDFARRQRDVVQFLPSIGKVLVPITEGVNPFRKFGVPYVPGNSLTINYRNEDNDTVLFLHGDNFVRVQVYSGEKPSE